MKRYWISFLVGTLFHVIYVILMLSTAEDWKHEGPDTEISQFFLLITIWPLLLLPDSLPEILRSIQSMWILTPFFNALIVFSVLFTYAEVRAKIAK